MARFLKSLWNNASGASAAEYALILALIGAGISVAAIELGDAIGSALENATQEITQTSNT